jgi:hypothetical protein
VPSGVSSSEFSSTLCYSIKGFTITPDQKFGVTVKDLCRPGTIATFMPNHKKPDYDDLVVLYQGKELFRYKRF